MRTRSLLSSLLLLTSQLLFAQPATDLQAFTEHWQGAWNSGEAGFTLRIEPSGLAGNQLAVYVPGLCQPGLAEALLFEWQDGSLHYRAARIGDRTFDLSRLAFCRLRPVIQGADSSLWFESEEMEYGYAESHRLRRWQRPPQATPDCESWQAFFAAALSSGEYELSPAPGARADEAQTPLPDALMPARLPAFQQARLARWCAQSQLPLVLLGSPHPTGDAGLFALEWLADEIRLYATAMNEADETISRGDLAFVLRLRSAPTFW